YALWMSYSGRSIFRTETFARLGRWFKEPLDGQRVIPIRLAMYGGWVVVTGLVLAGIVTEAQMARENLNAGKFPVRDVEAGMWLRDHTAPDSVLMARNWTTVYHYSERKLVWFPPISDPDVLIHGIERHHVDYVVTVKEASPYYLPDD